MLKSQVLIPIEATHLVVKPQETLVQRAREQSILTLQLQQAISKRGKSAGWSIQNSNPSQLPQGPFL